MVLALCMGWSLAAVHGAEVGPAQPGVPKERNVVLILVDGIRQQEWGGRAVDDAGRPVRFSELFPVLGQLRKRGLWLPNVSISNPAGVSLPAYADIFAGRRQEKILTNHPPVEDFRSHYPTLMQQAVRPLKKGFDGVALVASWSPLCAIAAVPPLLAEDDFFRSCGFKNNVMNVMNGAQAPSAPVPVPVPVPTQVQGQGSALPPGPGPFFKPEVYANSRTDVDTFLEFAREVPKRHPRLVVIHLGDADEEAHLHARVQRKTGQHYGIFHYHLALRQDDYLLGRIFDTLQADPFYRDNTYLLITTDHGRDTAEDPAQWASHGRCIAEKIRTKPCSGCAGVFALAVGPGIPARTARGTYKHTDLAPTVAKLLGIGFPTATGKPIREIVDPALRSLTQPTPPGPAFLTLVPAPPTSTAPPAPPASPAPPAPTASTASTASTAPSAPSSGFQPARAQSPLR